MVNDPRGPQKLWLAVIGTSLADVLRGMLFNEEVPNEDTAMKLLEQYPLIIARLQRVKSRESLENWLEEVEKQMENL